MRHYTKIFESQSCNYNENIRQLYNKIGVMLNFLLKPMLYMLRHYCIYGKRVDLIEIEYIRCWQRQWRTQDSHLKGCGPKQTIGFWEQINLGFSCGFWRQMQYFYESFRFKSSRIFIIVLEVNRSPTGCDRTHGDVLGSTLGQREWNFL